MDVEYAFVGNCSSCKHRVVVSADQVHTNITCPNCMDDEFVSLTQGNIGDEEPARAAAGRILKLVEQEMQARGLDPGAASSNLDPVVVALRRVANGEVA